MMKKILMFLFAGLILQSCKKQEVLPDLSSLTVVNAAIDAAAVKVYANEKQAYWSVIAANEAVNYSAFKHLGVITGSKKVMAAISADTTRILYNLQKDFTRGGMSTLLLCGQTGAYEGIYLENEQLLNYKEEVVGIRFVNLSPNSPSTNVVLSATPAVNEATGLTYKQVSGFKTYPTGDLKTGIAFQVRDAATDALLASYTLPATGAVSVASGRYKNITVVIKGLAGTTAGVNAFGVFAVSHF